MRKNPVITRLIKREGNTSTYSINGKPNAGREVQLLANNFNIQIDNLCQFLPQDKVVEFAQLSPVDLLASTQKAVAGPEMTKYHEDLKKLRNNHSTVIKEDQAARSELAHLERKQEDQRHDVERVRERARVKLRLERLEKSRIMLKYTSAKKDSQEAKERAKVLLREKRQLEIVSAPMLAKVQSKSVYEAAARASKATHETGLTASLLVCEEKGNEITEIEGEIQGKSNQIDAEKSSITKNKEIMVREQSKVRNLKRQKAESSPETFDVSDLTNEIQSLRARTHALQGQVDGLEQQETDLKDRGERRRADVIELDKQLEHFGSQASQQEQKLKSISDATFKAWEWVQQNQDQFTQRVYGPPIVECSLKDPNTANAVESILQISDFKFITVQNNADFRLLQQRLVGSKASGGLELHDVSLRECSNSSLDQFRPPVAPDQMQKLGLSHWAIDCLQGPATVLAQLCSERSLHKCGLSPREPTQQQHDDITKTDIQSYVGGQKVYRISRRREYGAAGSSAQVQDLRPARYWTDQPVDLGRKAALQRDRNEAHGEAVVIRSEWSAVHKQAKHSRAEKIQVDADYDAKKKGKEAIQRAHMVYKGLDVKIQSAEEMIKASRQSNGGVATRVNAIQEEFDDLLLKKTEAVLAFAAGARDAKSNTANLLEAEVILLEAVSDHQIATAQNNDVVQAIAQKTAENRQATETFKRQHELARSVKDAAMTLFEEGQTLAEEGDPSFSELIQHVCQTLKPDDNLEAEIDAEKARLDLTVDGSANVIAEYENRAKKIGRYKQQIEETSKQQQEFQHAIGEVRGKWEPRLDEVVGQINEAFSDSFARIGCAGQVAVHKASSDDPAECTGENGGTENGLDFDHWAIHISVKFRESEPLSLLDSHRQSGGERAVSTIFYLMALQSLSRAPFRVVDEINQGMDPRNERMVHGRMVDIAADDGGSQYFLITPKLLSGLKYRRGMTVLCIVSGENVPAARERGDDGEWQDGPKVDFGLFVKRARELGIAGSIGTRIDSGMGLGRSFTASQSPAVGA